MEELITVIIPVYNKDKYIKRTLNSIINQTYKNLEIIIVNDGSTDKSKDICTKFKEKDNRINLINIENHGAGYARNLGIDMANGKYISFIDADDYINVDYYKILHNMILKTDADIAECKYLRVKIEQKNIRYIKGNSNKVMTNIQKLKELYGRNEKKYVNTVIMCNKLFKKELFENIYYPTGRIIDDEFITYKLIYKSKKIVTTENELYFYVQSEDSVMRNDFKEKRVIDTIDAYDEVYKFIKYNNIQEIMDIVLVRYLNYCKELVQKTKKSNEIKEKDRVIKFVCKKFEEKKNILIDEFSNNIELMKELNDIELNLKNEIKNI